MVIGVCQHYTLHHFHSEFSSSTAEEVVVVLSRSDLHLTQHLVVISLMSSVSIRLGLDFMQVKDKSRQLCAGCKTGRERTISHKRFLPQKLPQFSQQTSLELRKCHYSFLV